MVGPTSYRLEVLFGHSFLIHFLLLWFAGTISWAQPRWWRVALAAAASGLLTLLPVLAPWGTLLLTTPAVVSVSIFLTLLLVWPCSLRRFGAVLGWLWAVAVATGGAVMLLAERDGPVAGLDVPLLLVASGCAAGMLGLLMVWQGHRERQTVRDALYQVQIQVGGQPVVLTGLVDSGNCLCTPIRRVPVAVVEAERLQPYLPPVLVEALTMGWDALSAIPEGWQRRCQLVPYATVGNPAGSMLVLVPDSVAIWVGRERRWAEVGGLIGLTLQPLDSQGHYQVLLPSPMLVEAEGK